MPAQSAKLLAGPCGPKLDRLVHTRRGQHLAVGGKCYARDFIRMPAQSAEFLTGPRVPQLDRVVKARGCQHPAVRGKRHARHPERMPAQGKQATCNVVLEQAPSSQSELRM